VNRGDNLMAKHGSQAIYPTQNGESFEFSQLGISFVIRIG
jgi:hypothetical protein